MQRWLHICISINVICHINKMKAINHMAISTDIEKALGKILTHPFMVKNFQQIRYKWDMAQYKKGYTWQAHWWNTKHFLPTSGTKQRCSLSQFLFNIIKVLAKSISQEKERKPSNWEGRNIIFSLWKWHIYIYIYIYIYIQKNLENYIHADIHTDTDTHTHPFRTGKKNPVQ